MCHTSRIQKIKMILIWPQGRVATYCESIVISLKNKKIMPTDKGLLRLV